ncbi:hypothetical protein [Leifsonia aquatica]|uniref:hypothetical protein n=1 Tax=Leifsonia aquatica TaxID=144185 RepID=UPI000468F885|nr:hypothetical protein [Leifsonia aquatica]
MATISDGATTLTPELVIGYSTQQDGRNSFHDILGRGDPDVSLAPAAMRVGTLNLFFLTEADADACRRLHARAAVFTYTATDNPTTSMRYVLDAGGIGPALDDQTRQRWTVAIAYREVAS